MKKYSTLLLLLALTVMHSVGAWAAEPPFSADRPFYHSFTGTITAVNEHHNLENGLFISLKSTDGQPANFVISEETFMESGLLLDIGQVITGYYDATRPMIMIYPPQYNVEAVISAESQDNFNVFAGYFDQNLISFDNILQIKTSDKTQIITTFGDPFEGSLENKKLLVYYGVSTRSIPAQTTPDKIIVLDDYFRSIGQTEPSTADMLINGQLYTNKIMYVTDDPMVYVPLRFIAEAFGSKVVWQGAGLPVLIGEKATLLPGTGQYTTILGEKATLRYQSEIRQGNTFVPLSFFRDILHINNAFYFEGRVEINNDQKFE